MTSIAMDRHDFHSLDDTAIRDAVTKWLTTPVPPDQAGDTQPLGEWLVTDAWRGWEYSPVELIFETTCLALGAASDAYDWEPDDVRLCAFDYRDGCGDTDHVYWLDSYLNCGWITLIGIWTDEDGDDADAYLPNIKPDVAALDAALGNNNTAALTKAEIMDATVFNVHDTSHCPIAAECSWCAVATGLSILAVDGPVGVYCLTVCERCGPTVARPEAWPCRAAELVGRHCDHLGIDLDQMPLYSGDADGVTIDVVDTAAPRQPQIGECVLSTDEAAELYDDLPDALDAGFTARFQRILAQAAVG